MARRHVVISGTGRSGTSYLVELLTHLGLPTGFTPEDIAAHKSHVARAGLEHDLRDPDAPFIVKSVWFCEYSEEILNRDDVLIEHVFIPMRDIKAAVESRKLVTAQTVATFPFWKRLRCWFKPKVVVGGLTTSASQQEDVLLHQIFKLTLSLSRTNVPVTLLHYPSIVNDAAYLYGKLQPILGDMPFPQFEAVFNKVARKDLVHSFTANDK